MKFTVEQQEKGADLLKNLTQKAWKSAAFKDQLINNPTATIEQVTGKSLKDLGDKRIVVEDQTDESVIYINIPAQMDINELELTEEELEMIAGGVTPVVYVVGAGVGYGLCWLIDKYN
jgi:hypothetical protein